MRASVRPRGAFTGASSRPPASLSTRNFANTPSKKTRKVLGNMSASNCSSPSVLATLPGDPSLIVHTNVTTTDAEGKKKFMKAASQALAKCLSKPESYVAVCVLDGLDMIWAGEDTPCALCSVISLGGINLSNNSALSKEICAMLGEDFGIPDDRVYIAFTDVPRENMGYKGATFAG